MPDEFYDIVTEEGFRITDGDDNYEQYLQAAWERLRKCKPLLETGIPWEEVRNFQDRFKERRPGLVFPEDSLTCLEWIKWNYAQREGDESEAVDAPKLKPLTVEAVYRTNSKEDEAEPLDIRRVMLITFWVLHCALVFMVFSSDKEDEAAMRRLERRQTVIIADAPRWQSGMWMVTSVPVIGEFLVMFNAAAGGGSRLLAVATCLIGFVGITSAKPGVSKVGGIGSPE